MKDRSVKHIYLLMAAVGAWGLMVVTMEAEDSASTNQTTIALPAWSPAATAVQVDAFTLGEGETRAGGWGRYSPNERRYFPDFLPAVFERTLVVDKLPAQRGFDWVFTGTRAGLYLSVTPKQVMLRTEFYDSPGFNLQVEKPGRYPRLSAPTHIIAIADGEPPRSISVRLDHTLTLTVSLNGREVHRQLWVEGFRRQQLRLTGKSGIAQFRLLQPAPAPVRVTINPEARHQTMLGWGGITPPPAYHELSSAGRQQWWQWLCEYNLLCQREYPNGGMLNRSMDNWDNLADAKAHYYADNFPNGEVSNFDYNRAIQSLGGFVIFEFWDFPAWIKDNPAIYAEAMVNYCQTAQRRTGQPPAIVGLQNEMPMKKELVEPFTVALRQGLDAAGFQSVKIHLANASRVSTTLDRLPAYRDNPKVWSLTDYSASNEYDYQNCFRDPDQFDATLNRLHERTGDKPYLAVELCINDNRYQSDGYGLALVMAELYHKNLTLADASLLCYCWTLLNIEQPTFGMTRSLFVTDPVGGFTPRPSSQQLRVFGAFSRRIQAGMQRVGADTADTNLLVTAFAGSNDERTVVLMNRSTAPMEVTLDWPGATFTQDELTDPYHQNTVLPAKPGNAVTIPPGGIVTRSSVPLKKLPPEFRAP